MSGSNGEMPTLDLSFSDEGDGVWRDVDIDKIVQAKALRMAGLGGGMVSGKATVGMLLEMPDGSYAFAETSLRLFLMAADALRARYGG